MPQLRPDTCREAISFTAGADTHTTVTVCSFPLANWMLVSG